VLLQQPLLSKYCCTLQLYLEVTCLYYALSTPSHSAIKTEQNQTAAGCASGYNSVQHYFMGFLYFFLSEYNSCHLVLGLVFCLFACFHLYSKFLVQRLPIYSVFVHM